MEGNGSSSVTALAVAVTVVSITLVAFNFTFYNTTETNYNILKSEQTNISSAISNLINQETSFVSVLQQQSSVVNSLQDSITNLNAVSSNSHGGVYINLTAKSVDYGGQQTAMLVANVTGYATLEAYVGTGTIPIQFYFAQKEAGPYYVVDCTTTTPNVCNSGSGNSIITVPVLGDFVGVTGITGAAQLYATG